MSEIRDSPEWEAPLPGAFTCHKCGGTIFGFSRVTINGRYYHEACGPIVVESPSDGGPVSYDLSPGRVQSVAPSLSLRDYFAAAALTGILANGSVRLTREIVEDSFELADAMLAARNKTEGKE